jgi:hypothetical protein
MAIIENNELFPIVLQDLFQHKSHLGVGHHGKGGHWHLW